MLQDWTYSVPVDWSPLSRIGPNFIQGLQAGQQFRQKQDLRDAYGQIGDSIQNGQPLDYGKLSGALFKAGDPQSAMSLMKLKAGQDADANFANRFGGIVSGAQSPGGAGMVGGGAGASGAAPAAPPSGMASLFTDQERQNGLPPGYLARTAAIESNFNPKAESPTGAKGLFQFTNGTARQYGLENPNDPVASTVAAARLASDNANGLRQVLGRDPTAGELYLAHQQGLGGAKLLLTNPNVPPAAMGLGQNVAVNGGDPSAPAAAFVSKWTSRFDGGAPAQGTQVAANGGFVPQMDGAAPGAAQAVSQAPQATSAASAKPSDADWIRSFDATYPQAVNMPAAAKLSIRDADNPNAAQLRAKVLQTAPQMAPQAVPQQALQGASQASPVTPAMSAPPAGAPAAGGQPQAAAGRPVMPDSITQRITQNLPMFAQAAINPNLSPGAQKFALAIAQGAIQANALPDDQKNYALYLSQGGTKDFVGFKQEMRPLPPVYAAAREAARNHGLDPTSDAGRQFIDNYANFKEARTFAQRGGPTTVMGPMGPIGTYGMTAQDLSEAQHTGAENVKARFAASQEANAAQQQLLTLSEMRHNFETMGESGFLTPGRGDTQRIEYARWAQDLGKAFHINMGFDENKLAAAQAVAKDQTRMGFDLEKTLGREPGFIVNAAIGAVPGVENSPAARKLIMASLEQAAQRKYDRSAFIIQNGPQYRDAAAAALAFDQAHPYGEYAGKALQAAGISPQGAAATPRLKPGESTSVGGVTIKRIN